MNTAIIDVGGGLRGIYGAGVFDFCLNTGIAFSHCIGVSAGSANVASFLAKQQGRNYPFYMDYSFRREYMSLHNFVVKRSYVDLDYVYGVLCNKGGENPLDYGNIAANAAELTVVATDALSGAPVYFGKQHIRQDDYAILKASCCIPLVDRPYMINGKGFFDGGVSDPVPLRYALSRGSEKTVVILTKPVNSAAVFKKEGFLSLVLCRKYPEIARVLRDRERRYKEGVSLAKRLQDEGKVLIIAPDDIGGMKTLTKDKKTLDELYRKGFCDARKITGFLG